MRKPNMPTMGDILRRKKDQFSTRIDKTGNWLGKQAQSTGSAISTGIGKTGAYLRERFKQKPQVETIDVNNGLSEAPNNVNFNKKLKQKNDVMKEYLQVQGILSRMSPEKRNVYSNIVGGLYEPHLKPYIKQETLSDVMGTQLPEEWRQYGDMPVSEFTRFYPELHKNKQENRTVGDVFGANLLKEIEPYKDMPYSDYLLLQPHLNKKKEDKLDNMTLGELFGNDEKKAARYYPDFPLSTTIGMLKKLGRITDMDMEYLKLIGE